MPSIKRIFQLLAAAIAYVLYVWFAAVRGAPAAKRRRAAKRAARRHPTKGGGGWSP
jgi:hypothetical protein